MGKQQRESIQAATWIVAFLAIVGVLASGPSVARAAEAPIKLGLLGPMTGPAAGAGKTMMLGVKLAMKEINASGGFGGRQLVLVVADDQDDPTLAVVQAKRLAFDEKVTFVLGPNLSGNAIAAMPVFNKAKIAQISHTISLKLTPKFAPYFFSMGYSTVAATLTQIDYIEKHMKVKSIGVIEDGTEAAKVSLDTMRSELPKRHMTLAGSEDYRIGQTDFTPELLALRRDHPDVLVLYSTLGADVGRILKGLAEIGWKVPVIGGIGVAVFPQQVIKIAGPNAFDDVAAINIKAFTYCPGEPMDSGAVPKFEAKLKAFAPGAVGKVPLILVGWYYDAVELFKAAYDGTGGKTDGPSIAAWIEQHAKSLKLLGGVPQVSKTSHFMLSENSLTLVVHPERKRADGLQRRADCN
jgi:branched-chain amino acid transport system substrate-binding protein